MHDVHTLESTAGVPSVAIVSTGFATQAIFQAESLGCTEPDKHIVLAEHPISDATPAELASKFGVQDLASGPTLAVWPFRKPAVKRKASTFPSTEEGLQIWQRERVLPSLCSLNDYDRIQEKFVENEG